MNKHSIIKTALGTGLMAASLAASAAAIHSFTTPMAYYKLDGAKVNYVAFVPSGPQTGFQGAAGVIMLELYNSGSVSTWNFAMGGAPTNASGAGAAWTDGAGVSFTAPGYPITSANTIEYSVAANNFSFGDTQTISLEFTQAPVISSVACNVTFAASIGTDDYLQFKNFTVQPAFWSDVTKTFGTAATNNLKATGVVTYSGGTVTGTIASDTWNSPNFSATSRFSGTISVPVATGGNVVSSMQTFGASSITKANLCTNAYTAKNALNSAGSTIGGKEGMMRLW